MASGKPVFRVCYRVNLMNPVINSHLTQPKEFTPGPYVLTVEFDGAAPGHPLSRMALAPAPRRSLPMPHVMP